jgi:hypothetical protein
MEGMEKQTAVEWLVEKLLDNGVILVGSDYELIEEAKEMEKQQIIDCYEYIKYNLFAVDSGEQYYNETFKSE